MYKPHTIEQYKIQQFLDHTFAMEHFLVSPLSRSALMLEDRCGERIAFSFSDNEVREIPIPSAPSPDKVKSFIRSFRALGAKPHLRTFEDVTRWWLNHPNPLTYQQALGLPDELYRRFLSSTLIEDEDAQRLAASGLVSEDAYQDIQLWYLNGNTADCWPPRYRWNRQSLCADLQLWYTPGQGTEILPVGRLLPPHEPHIVTRRAKISIYSIISLDKHKIRCYT